MPSRENRKIINLGKSSKGISLPKPFLDYHSIGKGDNVTLLYNGIILVFPKGTSSKILEDKADLVKKLLEI